jgi:hypothetical protein
MCWDATLSYIFSNAIYANTGVTAMQLVRNVCNDVVVLMSYVEHSFTVYLTMLDYFYLISQRTLSKTKKWIFAPRCNGTFRPPSEKHGDIDLKTMI